MQVAYILFVWACYDLGIWDYFPQSTRSHFIVIEPHCWWPWNLNLRKLVGAYGTGKRIREFSLNKHPSLDSVLTFSDHTVGCLHWSTCLTSFLPLQIPSFLQGQVQALLALKWIFLEHGETHQVLMSWLYT